jgi:hypothetical protein
MGNTQNSEGILLHVRGLCGIEFGELKCEIG